MRAYESPTVRASFMEREVLDTVVGFVSTYSNFNDPILDFTNG